MLFESGFNGAILWVVFNIAILIMLVIDLFVVNRKAHVIPIRQAAKWSAVWIGTAGLFNILIYLLLGRTKAIEFLAGYIVEESLSVDNMFVFAVIFSYFNIPAMYRPRVLKWGIIGAVVTRALMIFAGAALLQAFHWMIFVFGGFLVVTGIKLWTRTEVRVEPEKNLMLRLFKRFAPVTNTLDNGKFLTWVNGVRVATPLLVALIVVESTDIGFALDSIPAVFAITDDVFIVYTSNIFAILGLRALYFLIAGVLSKLAYLKSGLSAILVFIGVKMVISDFLKIPTELSLLVVFGILGISILASLSRATGKEGQQKKADVAAAGDFQ